MLKIAVLISMTIMLPFAGTSITMAQNPDKADPIRAHYSADQVSPSVYIIHGPLAEPNQDNQGFMN